MYAQHVVLVSLMVALAGCQREASAPAPAAPSQPAPAVTAAPPAVPAPIASAVKEAAPPVAAPASQPAAPAAKPAATALAPKSAATAPAPQTVAPAPATQAAVADKPAAASSGQAMAATAAMTGPTAAGASDPLQLAKAKGCFACHTLDKKLVGPAWKDVAAKYRGDATAEAKLVDKVGKGGSGVWGPVAMPPNVLVSEADRKTLVKYILSLK